MNIMEITLFKQVWTVALVLVRVLMNKQIFWNNFELTAKLDSIIELLTCKTYVTLNFKRRHILAGNIYFYTYLS